MGIQEGPGSGPAQPVPLTGVPGSCEVVSQDGEGGRRGLGLAWPTCPADWSSQVPQGGLPEQQMSQKGPGSSLTPCTLLAGGPGFCKVVCPDGGGRRRDPGLAWPHKHC